jgi:hypothetical protein
MTLSLTRRALGGLGGVALSLALATTVLAAGPTWQSPKDIRISNWFVFPEDAASAGSALLAVWTEFDFSSDATRVGFKVSDDAGANFGALNLVPDATGAGGAICGSKAKVVTTRMNTPTTWTVELRSGDVSGGAFTVQPIAASSQELTGPDVACTDDRIFVSWREHTTGENVRLLVASALLSDHVFGAPMSLGQQDRNFPSGLALAGSGDHAYAAFNRLDGRLRVKRWSVGPGPTHPLSSGPAVVVGGGTENRPAYEAAIDAHGDNVGLTWGRCANVLARVSTDAGATWGPVRMIEDGFGCNVEDAFSGPGSIAARRSRMALVYNISGIPNASIDFLVTTNRNFANFVRSELGEHQHHIVTFVSTPGGLRLADIFNGSNGHRIKFRRQV